MTFYEKVEQFKKRFKLTEHHAIERFGWMIGALIVMGAIVWSGSLATAFVSNKDDRENTALYTGEFTTSKTNRDGEVGGVYRNEDGSRALVMMKFADPALMSKNADDYQVFITGLNYQGGKKYITQKVTGQTMVMGSTGWMGVVITSDKPLDPMVYQLSMRSKEDVTAGAEDVSQEDIDSRYGGDESFAKFDQWRVGFNPRALTVEHVEALDTDNVEPVKVYTELLVSEQEQELRDKAEKGLKDLKADLNRINVTQSNLQKTKVDNISVVPPEVPKYIKGDKVTGEEKTSDGQSSLRLETENVMPGGWDFDWRAGSVSESYLDNLVAPGQSYVDFLKAKKEKEDEADDSTSMNLAWKLSNGDILSEDSSDSPLQPLIDAKNDLEGAYSKYLEDKRTYQVDTLGAMIELEVQLRGVESSSSVNASEKDFTVY